MRNPDLVILIPVYNDWTALGQLLAKLDGVLLAHSLTASVLVVDDASTSPISAELGQEHFRSVSRVEVLRLRTNLGHQRAICIGLAYIEDKVPCEAVVVMDGDGQDDPSDVPRLIDKLREGPGEKIVFAERTRRVESPLFMFFYVLYKWMHKLLTGHAVRVGNFSVIPLSRLKSLVVLSQLWNHYAAAVYGSRQPFCTIPTKRTARLVGQSKMNFVSFVIHGLSAISVFSDTVGVRLLVANVLLVGLTIVGTGCVVAVRVFTDLAIPGWATFVGGLLVVILLQAIAFGIMYSFIILSGRRGATFLPARDYGFFVEKLDAVYEKT